MVKFISIVVLLFYLRFCLSLTSIYLLYSEPGDDDIILCYADVTLVHHCDPHSCVLQQILLDGHVKKQFLRKNFS